MTVEANAWNKNNSAWREFKDSTSIAIDVSVNHEVSWNIDALPDGSVGSAQIIDGSIGADEIADGAVGIAELAAVTKVCNIIFIIDGGGAAITTGVKGDLEIPFACAISQWTLLGDQSGSIVVDVWKDTYANYPPVVGDSITASAKPTISSATKGQSSTLTGWTTTIAAGDTLRFNVDSITSLTRCQLALKVTRT